MSGLSGLSNNEETKSADARIVDGFWHIVERQPGQVGEAVTNVQHLVRPEIVSGFDLRQSTAVITAAVCLGTLQSALEV